MPRPRGRRAYNRVSEDDDGDIENQPVENETSEEEKALTTDSQQAESTDEKDADDDGERVTVVVMDPAQNKFEISLNPSWSVARFKKEGAAVHKISSGQQRLIFMGRLLADDTILSDAKINRDGLIVHLFPKPRVVVQSNQQAQTDADSGEENGEAGGGAHVPQIVLDPDEAQMRSQILVLGSAEILDAQNNVKLLSFLLLIITSMELLALFTIMLGVPQNVPDDVSVDDNIPTDDIIHHHHNSEGRTWRNSDYFDLALNLFGFYSAMLGIKATTENTRRLAYRYLVCTVICGVLWNAFYYYLNYQVEKAIDEEQHKTGIAGNRPRLTTQDYLVQAFFSILIPMMIWCMCCMRAYQFHHLLEEAELEAEERIQNELRMQEEGGADDDDDDIENQTGVML